MQFVTSSTMVMPMIAHVSQKALLLYFGFHWCEKYYGRFAAFFGTSERYEVDS
jgi:hypothetical protein